MLGTLALVLAVAVLVMLSAGGLAYALLYGRIEQEDVAARRLDFVQHRSRTEVVSGGRAASDPARRRRQLQDTLKELEAQAKAQARQSTSPTMATRIQQAGLTWSRRTFIIISIVSGAIIFLLCLPFLPRYAAFAFGIAGLFGVPRWIVNRLRNRRIRKFVDEFANAVDVIVRGVKSGLPLNDCIRVIANEAAEPVKSEFRTIIEAQSLGITLADAINKLHDRVPVPEASFFGIVVAIQQRAGGNLSEALGNLSRVLRERKKMKGKIGAMAMEAKASAWIIGSLPIVVMVLVFLTSPNYIMLLFTEPLGRVILGVSAVWMLTGVFVMRRMINFDF